MKVLRSIKSAKLRHRDCRVVKRKGGSMSLIKLMPDSKRDKVNLSLQF